MKRYILPIVFALFTLNISCNNDFNDDITDVVVKSGEADFSRYVALGNSLTSGYRDNALYITGQRESYPFMLAEQMKKSGGGEFKIPSMADELGGIPDANIENKKILSIVGSALSPILASGTGSTTLVNIYSQGPYQNMGIPSAKSFHLIEIGYGNPNNLSAGKANPYFIRFASHPNATVLEDAISQNPTFFSLWIGNNDILGYATSGGDGSDLITDIATFKNAYTRVVQAFVSKGAKGVIANLPNVTDIPYFTTVSSKPFTSDQFTSRQIEELNEAYKNYNLGLDKAKADKIITPEEAEKRKILFVGGVRNGAVIADKEVTNLTGMGLPSIRMSTTKDLLLLPVSSILKKGGGTSMPLEDKYVLTEKEIENINTATKTFNAIIKDLTLQYNLAFADISSLMKELNSESGIRYDGVNYTSIFITGGAFSLDGVHPTGRGYAFIANEFIRAINQKYNSNLPKVNPNRYQAVNFP